MSDEAAFSVTKNFHTIRGDNWAEFQANVEALLGEGSYQRVAESFQEAFGVSAAQAVATVQQAFPQAQVAQQPVATVGQVPAQPLPQPAAPAPQPQVTQAAPPTAPYPGDCAHGTRSFKNSQTKRGMWARWECHLDWVKGNDAHNNSRCPAVNV